MSELALLVGLFGVTLLLAFAAWYVISVYNNLVSLHKRVEQTRQNIDVRLQQRQDELTKLIDAANVYMDHEEELMTELTGAREKAEQARTPAEKAVADQNVRSALAAFRARAEQYPDLRSQGNVLQVQERIEAIEEQISARRELYNDAVTRYNTKISQFPYFLIAPPLGYDDVEMFVTDEETRNDVNVAAQFD